MRFFKTLIVLSAFCGLAGCAFQKYHARPISPAQTAASLESRTLADPGLREFLTVHSQHPPAVWPPAQWDLPRLTLAALYFNPALQVGRAQVSQAEAAVTTAKARPNPTLSGDLGGETAPESPWIAGLVGSLPLETAGKRGRRVTAAEKAADVARWDLAAAAWDVRARLRASLLDYIAADRNRNLLRTQERLRAEQVQLLEQRLAVGTISRPEVDAARLQHTQSLLAAQAAEGRVGQAQASLAAALGLPTTALQHAQLAWPGLEQPPPASFFPAPAIQQEAVLNRLDIRRTLAQYALAEAALRLQVARQYPDFNLGPDYAFEEGAHLFSVVLGLTLPVFQHNQGPIAEAKARRELMAAQFLTVQAAGIAKSEQALVSYDAALKQFAQAEELVRQSHLREQSAQNALQAGAGDRLALNGAQLQTTVAEVARLNSLVAAQQALGDLENAVQRPLQPGDLPPFSPRSPLLKANR